MVTYIIEKLKDRNDFQNYVTNLYKRGKNETNSKK